MDTSKYQLQSFLPSKIRKKKDSLFYIRERGKYIQFSGKCAIKVEKTEIPHKSISKSFNLITINGEVHFKEGHIISGYLEEIEGLFEFQYEDNGISNPNLPARMEGWNSYYDLSKGEYQKEFYSSKVLKELFPEKNRKILVRASFGNEGIPNGKWELFDAKSSQIKEFSTYRDGILHGESGIYFPNTNQLMEVRGYKNGIAHGEWKSWYENGQLNIIGKYNESFKSGKWVSFYENGSKNIECHFEKGKRAKYYSKWYKNAVLAEEGNFKNGNKGGDWKYYFQDGLLKRKVSYDKGRIMGEWKEYYFIEHDETFSNSDSYSIFNKILKSFLLIQKEG